MSTEKLKDEMPLNILIAEDDDIDVDALKRIISRSNTEHNVFIVKNGEEAIDFIYNRVDYLDKNKYPRPDLILSDINMPKVSGLELLKTLKRDPLYQDIPVVMCTSSKRDEDIMKSFTGGATNYVSKPVTEEDFLKAVNGFDFEWHIGQK